MRVSTEVWDTISATQQRLLVECIQYVVDHKVLPSMFPYQWATLSREQKLLMEFTFYRFGFLIDSQGKLVL